MLSKDTKFVQNILNRFYKTPSFTLPKNTMPTANMENTLIQASWKENSFLIELLISINATDKKKFFEIFLGGQNWTGFFCGQKGLEVLSTAFVWSPQNCYK